MANSSQDSIVQTRTKEKDKEKKREKGTTKSPLTPNRHSLPLGATAKLQDLLGGGLHYSGTNPWARSSGWPELRSADGDEADDGGGDDRGDADGDDDDDGGENHGSTTGAPGTPENPRHASYDYAIIDCMPIDRLNKSYLVRSGSYIRTSDHSTYTVFLHRWAPFVAIVFCLSGTQLAYVVDNRRPESGLIAP